MITAGSALIGWVETNPHYDPINGIGCSQSTTIWRLGDWEVTIEDKSFPGVGTRIYVYTRNSQTGEVLDAYYGSMLREYVDYTDFTAEHRELLDSIRQITGYEIPYK